MSSGTSEAGNKPTYPKASQGGKRACHLMGSNHLRQWTPVNTRGITEPVVCIGDKRVSGNGLTCSYAADKAFSFEHGWNTSDLIYDKACSASANEHFIIVMQA
ncbi:hypothetical protein MSG28_001765 [Choristoneura fumiferana]|uniref:Uncharacterized protein n=1 Tax=Choristoneura fumiferana TaxID=7141 RepID=A0ACC0KW21_CHOFU|nr:hypothetical protein MSG28_001765 [Choristoneura fumiferana]